MDRYELMKRIQRLVRTARQWDRMAAAEEGLTAAPNPADEYRRYAAECRAEAERLIAALDGEARADGVEA